MFIDPSFRSEVLHNCFALWLALNHPKRIDKTQKWLHAFVFMHSYEVDLISSNLLSEMMSAWECNMYNCPSVWKSKWNDGVFIHANDNFQGFIEIQRFIEIFKGTTESAIIFSVRYIYKGPIYSLKLNACMEL